MNSVEVGKQTFRYCACGVSSLSSFLDFRFTAVSYNEEGELTSIVGELEEECELRWAPAGNSWVIVKQNGGIDDGAMVTWFQNKQIKRGFLPMLL